MCVTGLLKQADSFQKAGYAQNGHDNVLYHRFERYGAFSKQRLRTRRLFASAPCITALYVLERDFNDGFRFRITTIEKKKPETMSLAFKFDGGRYKIRTCDPIRVKDMLYP